MGIIVVLLVGLVLYLHFGGMAADRAASKYVKALEDSGVECTKHRQDSGPPHARKRYWVCDGETIKWWHKSAGEWNRLADE